jgi:hypothetical protein
MADMVLCQFYINVLLDDDARDACNLTAEECTEMFATKDVNANHKLPKHFSDAVLRRVGEFFGMDGGDLYMRWSPFAGCKVCPCTPGYNVTVKPKAVKNKSDAAKEQSRVRVKDKLRFNLTKEGRLRAFRMTNSGYEIVTEELGELEL